MYQRKIRENICRNILESWLFENGKMALLRRRFIFLNRLYGFKRIDTVMLILKI
jgi:hypothetical protein